MFSTSLRLLVLVVLVILSLMARLQPKRKVSSCTIRSRPESLGLGLVQ